MEYFKECTCPSEIIPIDFSTTVVTEDFEEIDEDELIEDKLVPHNLIWKEISDKFDDERKQIAEYKASKSTDCVVSLNPAHQFLEDHIFSLLSPIIIEATINKAQELECIKHQKNAFNSIDFIAEMLWNLNPKYPERKANWTYIFDMNWVVDHLEKCPRPFYPFSWIWSKEYAAIKIQSGLRGYWIRSREDVQEMRQYWKAIKESNEETTTPQSESTDQ